MIIKENNKFSTRSFNYYHFFMIRAFLKNHRGEFCEYRPVEIKNCSVKVKERFFFFKNCDLLYV